MTKVSFIIPSYNTMATIPETVSSILRLDFFDNNCELIVVDSSSDEKTIAYLDSIRHPAFRLIRLEAKTGPGTGRNIGAKAAKGDLLCFIDADVFLSKDWLQQVLHAYRLGCMAGCGSVNIPESQKDNLLALAQLYLQFNESLDVGETRKVTMVPACNMFIDRELFERVGGFPNMRASEDVLLCLAVGEFTSVWFIPKAKCFHIFRQSFESYFNNQKVLGKYIIIYRRLKYDRWYYKSFWPALMLPGFLIIKAIRIQQRILHSDWHNIKQFAKTIPLFFAGLFYWGIGFWQGCFVKE